VVHLLQRYRNTWKESNTGFKVSYPVTVITNPPYCKTQKMLGYNTATATKSKEKLDQKKICQHQTSNSLIQHHTYIFLATKNLTREQPYSCPVQAAA
jgi:hypothetical protein